MNFHVDNISISGALECNPENSCEISPSGDAWVDQLYDYGGEDRPGYQVWDEYLPGMAFNNNPSMD